MQKEEKENSKIMHCAVKLKDYFFPQTWARIPSFVCRLKSKLNLSTNLFQSYFILSSDVSGQLDFRVNGKASWTRLFLHFLPWIYWHIWGFKNSVSSTLKNHSNIPKFWWYMSTKKPCLTHLYHIHCIFKTRTPSFWAYLIHHLFYTVVIYLICYTWKVTSMYYIHVHI